MRFLRKTTMEEVNDIIERSSDKMLIYVSDAPAGIPSIGIVQGEGVLNIIIKFFRGYMTPAATYEYAFDPSTVLADAVNIIFEDHLELSSGYNIYLVDREVEEINPPYRLDTFLTLSELGVTNGSTLSFIENLE